MFEWVEANEPRMGCKSDRIFYVAPNSLRIASAGVLHQAQQWALVCEKSSEGERPSAETQRSHPRSPVETETDQSVRERGERWERPSTYENLEEPDSYSYGNTTDKRSPTSPHSPSDCSAEVSNGERAGERDSACSLHNDAIDTDNEVLQ